MATGSGAAIRTERLTKYYGRQLGVDKLDLEVRRGEIFGWLGPNGAGKTTAIRMLLNMIRSSGGRATVLGHDAVSDSIEVRRR
jgi:ABC-2 type transport system ATP-binding protein